MHDADLSKACLVGANLLEADLGGANPDGAIFCRTLMPGGSINDSGCNQGTRCCPTRCRGKICPSTCEHRWEELCSVIGFPTPVDCEPLVCTPTLVSPILTSCQLPCQSDEDCQSVLPGFVCKVNAVKCPYIGRCCGYPNLD